jgi:hypothetical protein
MSISFQQDLIFAYDEGGWARNTESAAYWVRGALSLHSQTTLSPILSERLQAEALIGAPFKRPEH